MARWREIVESAPQFAASVRRQLDARTHKTIATLRADGSPRISPVEPYLALRHLLLGMEWPTNKARDLLRDPRCAVHSVVSDPDGADGEFKLYGRAVLTEDPSIVGGPYEAWWHRRQPQGYRVFSVDIESAAFIGWEIEADQMRLIRWSPDAGVHEVVRPRPK